MKFSTKCFVCRDNYLIGNGDLCGNGILIKLNTPTECIICLEQKSIFIKLNCDHSCCEKCMRGIYKTLHKDYIKAQKQKRKQQMIEAMIKNERLRLREIFDLELLTEKRIHLIMLRRINSLIENRDDDNFILSRLMNNIANRSSLSRENGFDFSDIWASEHIPNFNINGTHYYVRSELDKYTFMWCGVECMWIKNLSGVNDKWTLVNISSRELYKVEDREIIIPPPPYLGPENTSYYLNPWYSF